MIIITGGAGMIGSMVAWCLNQQGDDHLLIVDDMHHPEQWQNLCHRKYVNYLDQRRLPDFLAHTSETVRAVIHMGAISDTTEQNWQALLDHNVYYSQFLWDWCVEKGVPFFYASSAATYGAGEGGYDDVSIEGLRPLNAYGYSKHFFDQWVMRQVALRRMPPRWAGFKFFNVYGPNEYHKQRMASMVFHGFHQLCATGTIRLFRSHREDIADGLQSRDFVYVKDVASVLCWFVVQEAALSGLYNIGSGEARSFLDVATLVAINAGYEPSVTWIDMPADLDGRYQYFTQACIARLREA